MKSHTVFQPRTEEERVLWRRLQAVAAIQTLPATATLAETISKLNEVIAKLRAITVEGVKRV